MYSRHDDPRANKIVFCPQVDFPLQEGAKYASVLGVAAIEQNSKALPNSERSHWRAWCAEGRENQLSILIKAKTPKGEDWNITSSNCLDFVFEADKAVFQREVITSDHLSRHAKVNFLGDDQCQQQCKQRAQEK